MWRNRASAIGLATLLVTGVACASGDESAGREGNQGAVAAATPAARPGGDTVLVYKSPTCGCCQAWVDTMRANGFAVQVVDMADVAPMKRTHGVPEALGSCHTALVGTYVVEGHVPPADIRRLLAERPDVVGIAVPGMPMGSPGMEGPRKEPFDVIAFTRAGAQTVYSRR